MTTLNFNVGVLGHVDSGKTSLSKALSSVGSTAAFDKNPQSQARGITLDLGFSAFDADVSADEGFRAAGINKVQFTLVDCPGHASLIRTVLGGAQIIDVMILVIDITKGIQTQTAECIVVGEILARRLVVVLNKIDAVQGNTPEERAATVAKTKKKLRAVFSKTRWPNAPFVETAANPGAGSGDAAQTPPVGLDALTQQLVAVAQTDVTRRAAQIAAGGAAAAGVAQQDDLLMMVDHCFPIKGQGTVLTGTVLQGTIRVGEDIYLPDHRVAKRVKGIQMFRKPVTSATKGDRVGVCVTQFAADDMERGIVCGVGSKTVISVKCCVARVHKVRFHKLAVEPGLKYHITVGHTTVMGTLRFFSKTRGSSDASAAAVPAASTVEGFDFAAQYDCLEELPEASEVAFGAPAPDARPEDQLDVVHGAVDYYAVVLLEQPVTCFVGAVMIVSRLDTDIHASTCRIAAHGVVLTPDLQQSMFPAAFPKEEEPWRMIDVVRPKMKQIMIDRVLDETSCIAKSITAGSHNPDPERFIGAKISLRKIPPKACQAAATDAAAEIEVVPGVIEAPFGKSGKVRLKFSKPVFDAPKQTASAKPKPKGKNAAAPAGAEDETDATAEGASAPPADVAVPGRARIEIVLSYRKHPFATVHRFE